MANNDSAAYETRFNAVTQTLEYAIGGNWVTIPGVGSSITAAEIDSQVATNGQVLTADGAGGASFETPASTGSVGAAGEMQYSDGAGNFDSDPKLVWDELNSILEIDGNVDMGSNELHAGALVDATNFYTLNINTRELYDEVGNLAIKFTTAVRNLYDVNGEIILNFLHNGFITLNAGAGSLQLQAATAVAVTGTTFTFNGIPVSTAAAPSVVDSSATVGGAAIEAVTVAGLLTTSTIWAVTQRTKGGSNLPLLSWTNTVNGQLNVIYSADMGVGAVVRVLFIP